MRALLILLLVGVAAAAEQHAPEAHPSQRFVIGLSPFLNNSVKDDVYRSIVRLLVQDLPLNSSVKLYDAFHLRLITEIAVPNARAFESPKTRANQFAGPIRDLKQFLAEEHPRPASAHLMFDDALALPQFCDFLSENTPVSKARFNLLLLGSPLYQDQKEPGFSMVDGYFPSDGHLQAARDKSIYGITDGESTLQFAVHWVYFGDPWLSDLHKEKLTRFWTLYLERRGGELVTFCGDLPTATQAFQASGPGRGGFAGHWQVDPEQTKIEMLRIGREVETVDWIRSDSVAGLAQKPPAAMVGPMKIGIRWTDNIDLDLYATPREGAETLFFQHLRSPEGYYYKDHRSSPGREYEFIEFQTPVDIREVSAFVNFYKGSSPGGPRGEVRIEYENKIYSARFAIVASHGNRGRAGDSQEDYWTRVPIQEILKLAGPTARN
jgi:hypothetical protein